MKTIVILADGMRPDALEGIGKAEDILGESAYSLNAKTVFPPVTLPCHISLFHSVGPERHGTTTNVYMPQVRPITGLFEVLKTAGLRSAMFYNWAELRDVCRPGSLVESHFFKSEKHDPDRAHDLVTECVLSTLEKREIDFAFVYFELPDAAGHRYGWMSPEYRRAIVRSWDSVDSIVKRFGNQYQIIITADHGGHNRTHGAETDEDMTVPVILRGSAIKPGVLPGDTSILDIAPTVVSLFGLSIPDDWEGKNLLSGRGGSQWK